MTDKFVMKPVFAKMATADFYPEGANEKYIEITVQAPFDTEVFPGDVVILDANEYKKLIQED